MAATKKGLCRILLDELAERDAESGVGCEEGVPASRRRLPLRGGHGEGRRVQGQRGYGEAPSRAAAGRFKHTFTFQDMRQTRIRLGKENEICRAQRQGERAVSTRSSASLLSLRTRTGAGARDDVGEIPADEDSADVILQAGIPKRGFWSTGIAAHKDIAVVDVPRQLQVRLLYSGPLRGQP